VNIGPVLEKNDERPSRIDQDPIPGGRFWCGKLTRIAATFNTWMEAFLMIAFFMKNIQMIIGVLLLRSCCIPFLDYTKEELHEFKTAIVKLFSCPIVLNITASCILILTICCGAINRYESGFEPIIVLSIGIPIVFLVISIGNSFENWYY